MAGSILAVTINSQGGSYMTFFLPVGVFCVVSVVLYVMFSKPRTVPGHRDLAPAQASGASGGSGSASGTAQAPGQVPAPAPGSAAATAGDGAGNVSDAATAPGQAAAGDAPGAADDSQRETTTTEGTEAGE